MPTHDDALLLCELPPGRGRHRPHPRRFRCGLPPARRGITPSRGRPARPPTHPSAICHRDAAYQLFTVGLAPLRTPAASRTRIHAAGLVEAMSPWSNGARPGQLRTSREPAILARRYDRATLDRLARIAEGHDPYDLLPDSRATRAAAANGPPATLGSA